MKNETIQDSLIKGVQKFLNAPFYEQELLIFLDKSKDFLLQPYVISKTEDNIYNSLWDMLLSVEKEYSFGIKTSIIIGTKISVLAIYDYHYKERISIKK